VWLSGRALSWHARGSGLEFPALFKKKKVKFASYIPFLRKLHEGIFRLNKKQMKKTWDPANSGER
jgi:hypothetical protein